MYWNKKESHVAWSAVGLAYLYSDKTTKRKGGLFMMYPVYAELLNFSVEL